MSEDLANTIRSIAEASSAAALVLATAGTEVKDAALEKLALLLKEATPRILSENKKDLAAGEANGLSPAMLDRLKLTEARIEKMAAGVREVIALADPLGEELERTTRPNGLLIRKVRVPIGVIGIIYESRPNVTVDCAILCLKSGNASILRGGKEAFYTNQVLAGIISEALSAVGLPPAAVQLVPTTDRSALVHLLKMDDLVHCIIPRGGESLIRFVAENARMPVIKHYTGVCCMYVAAGADLKMATDLVVNAKTQRPGVCNAIENLWVDASIAATALPQIAQALVAKGVKLNGCQRSIDLLRANGIACDLADDTAYFTEYLDLVLSIKIVDTLEEAIAVTNRYGSHHSDAIVTSNEAMARKFMAAVDSATVYWNASTRFTDGYEFGLGAEIGISTDKLHARGPMGLKELCSYKYLIDGNGQIRN